MQLCTVKLRSRCVHLRSRTRFCKRRSICAFTGERDVCACDGPHGRRPRAAEAATATAEAFTDDACTVQATECGVDDVNMPADVGYAQGHMQCTQRKLSSDEYAYDQSTKVSDVLGSCAVLIHIFPASLGSDCTVLRIRYREPRGRSLLLPCRHGRCHKTREGSGENGTNDQTEQSKVQTSLAVCMLLCIQQIVGVLRSYAERSPNFGASCMRKMHTL